MAKTRTLRNLDERLQSVQWDDQSPLTVSVETPQGTVSTRHGKFIGAVRSEGV